MRLDSEIKRDVQDELRWDTDIDAPSRAAGAFWCHYELIWAVSRLPQF